MEHNAYRRRWLAATAFAVAVLVGGSLGVVFRRGTAGTRGGDWLGFVPYRDGRLLCSGRVYGVAGEEIHYARDYRRP